MRVRKIGFVGTRTERPEAMAAFLEHVLGLTAEHAGDDMWAGSRSSTESVGVHVLATGRMRKYRALVHGVAIYGCCRAYYTFKVVPNLAGKLARIGLDVRTPDGDWDRLDTKSFKLRRDSTVTIFVQIAHPGGHTFQLTGCVRDRPELKGWCSRGDRFRFSP